MCDGDPPTPEEDSETQPDEEEEEPKVSTQEVGTAIKVIRQLMEKFNLDLSTVTQALLKNSGSREQVQELTLGGCPQGAFLSLQLLEVLSDVGRQEHPTYRVLWRLVPVKT